MTAIALEYGANGHWEGDIPAERLLVHHTGPRPLNDVKTDIRACLESPLEFPALRRAIVPGDQVVVALDRNIQSAAEIAAEVCTELVCGGVSPSDILIMHPAALLGPRPTDPRRLLPEFINEHLDIRQKIGWKIHDPTAKDAIGYLASSAAGERIYLAREILNADFVIPISGLGYDAVQGRRHLMSAFYPGYSSTESFAKSLGDGHSELGPDDERPLSQLVRELTWLLGIQFAVQVLPSSGRSAAAAVVAGQPDAVTRHGQTVLDDNWEVISDQRGETVFVSVPNSNEEPASWEHLGAALDAARNLVQSEGRIIVLSDLSAKTSPGIDILRSSRSAKASLKPLRQESPPDLVAASQIARAADWASVYLLSQLDPLVVEELFMTPLGNEREATRLISCCDGCIVFDGAQHVWTRLVEE